MARFVSTALVRGLVRSCRASSTAAVPRQAFQQFMTYSSGLGGDSSTNGDSSTTRVAADPDTHQDFQPTSKGSGMSYHDMVAKLQLRGSGGASNTQLHQVHKSGGAEALPNTPLYDIKENPVLIYMKGCPDAPRCGFSALAVKVLKLYDVPLKDRDIFSNPKLKESVKAHTNWPTFPQIFIKGEFVGGSDIILSMHQKGELKDLLADIAQKG